MLLLREVSRKGVAGFWRMERIGGVVRGIRCREDGRIGLGLRLRMFEIFFSSSFYRQAFADAFGSDLVIRNLKILNPVAWVFSIGGSNVEMRNVFIDARSNDGFPFNTGMYLLYPHSFENDLSECEILNKRTDGIDLSASNVLIDGFEIHNGDDVINVSPPATNVTMRNIIASGTHGLSVSCASGTGGNYTFENAYIYDSLMAARFKGAIGKTCDVSNVTWRNIEVKNVSYPIHFIEDYYDQEKGIPSGTNTSIAAYAKGFAWEGINGSVAAVVGDASCVSDPCWYATTSESSRFGLLEKSNFGAWKFCRLMVYR